MSKISELVAALRTKTVEKKLKWDLQDEQTLMLKVGKNSIIVSSSFDEDLSPAFDIIIYNLDGVIVDRESFPARQPDFEAILDMTVQARRDLLRADETLDEIMDKVSQL